jgi:ABC-2 type transport system permease protein
MIRNSLAIAKKELNIYFATPIAYVMFTLFVVIGSYFFLRLLGAYEQASLAYMRFNSPEMMNRLNFQDAIFRNLFGNLGVILIFIIPFLTMRLVAEEKKQKTIELLYTTPVTPGEIVWGKYLAAIAILVCTLALTLTYPVLVQLVAKDQNGVEWRSVLLGYFGLFMMGAAYMAIGLFISSLTESQVVAALITFVVLLMTWIIGWTAGEAEGWVREVVVYLASVSHLDSFSKGTVELKDIVYFLSLITIGLFATHRAIEAHRWS